MISDKTWLHLLDLKSQLRRSEYLGHDGWWYHEDKGFVPSYTENAMARIAKNNAEVSEGVKISSTFNLIIDSVFDKNTKDALRTYLEVLFLPYDHNERTGIISHIAQSLDGKMATNQGHSQWIGNDNNLVHAHRVRALVDGVMVGTGTLIQDNPQLTVRHVQGDNPHRFFWSNSITDFTLYQAENTKTTLIRKYDPTTPSGVSDVICYGDSPGCEKTVLSTLKSKGIHSLLLEGGAWTINRFIQCNCIDIIQIHIAPIVLGSGKSPFKFSGTTRIDEALSLDGYFMHVGDHMMFTGRPSQE